MPRPGWATAFGVRPAATHPCRGVVKLTVDHAYYWLPRLREPIAGCAELDRHERGDLDVCPLGGDKASALRLLLGSDHPTVLALGNDAH